MRILTEPKVYLVSRPEFVTAATDTDGRSCGFDQFLADAGLRWPTPIDGVPDGSRIVEAAGRLCYMSYGQSARSSTNEAYVDNLLGRTPDGGFRPGPAHGSVVEHANYSFIVVGAGRGYSHEQVRHRVGIAFSQLSTRYCDFEREEQEGSWDPGFCIPPLAQLTVETSAKFEARLRQSQAAYVELLHDIERDLRNEPRFMAKLKDYSPRERNTMLRKAARGAARDLLPIGTEAIMFATANARAIWNMAYLRGSIFAEAVIRSVYVQQIKIMEAELPSVFKGIRYVTEWDGSLAVDLPRDKL
jgi:thymidylate synthase (FAD)